jgi:hypothetical protein
MQNSHIGSTLPNKNGNFFTELGGSLKELIFWFFLFIGLVYGISSLLNIFL